MGGCWGCRRRREEAWRRGVWRREEEARERLREWGHLWEEEGLLRISRYKGHRRPLGIHHSHSMQGETDACTQLLQTPFRGGDTASCNTPDTQKSSTTFSHKISKVTTQTPFSWRLNQINLISRWDRFFQNNFSSVYTKFFTRARSTSKKYWNASRCAYYGRI